MSMWIILEIIPIIQQFVNQQSTWPIFGLTSSNPSVGTTTTSRLSQVCPLSGPVVLHWRSTKSGHMFAKPQNECQKCCPPAMSLVWPCPVTAGNEIETKTETQMLRLRIREQVEVRRLLPFYGFPTTTWLCLPRFVRARCNVLLQVQLNGKQRETKRNRSMRPGRAEINCQPRAAIAPSTSCCLQKRKIQNKVLIKHKETNFPSAPRLCGKIELEIGEPAPRWIIHSFFSRSSNYFHCNEACAQAHCKIQNENRAGGVLWKIQFSCLCFRVVEYPWETRFSIFFSFVRYVNNIFYNVYMIVEQSDFLVDVLGQIRMQDVHRISPG